MSEETCPVWSLGQLAVVTLPEYLDRSNAGRVREQLLLVINRGAAVLIADLAATVSCNYFGVEALERAYQDAIARGTELRLVVTDEVVRHELSLIGLDRLVLIYPTLKAAAAGGERQELPGECPTATATPAVQSDLLRAAARRAARAEELLDGAVSTIFIVGVSLEAAVGQAQDLTSQRMTEALGGLDDTVREIRDHVFADQGEQIRPGLGWRPPPDLDERFERTVNRAAWLHRRAVQTARALHAAAADTAVLLEQRADLLEQPGRIDYPADIKRWRVIADQAAEIAERWERRP